MSGALAPTFPQELFNLFIVQIARDKNRPSLKNLSLVCRAWCSIARRYLFDKVAFNSATAAAFLALVGSQHSTLTGHLRQLSFAGYGNKDDGYVAIDMGDKRGEDEKKEEALYQASQLSWAETARRLRDISVENPKLLSSVRTLILIEVSLDSPGSLDLTGHIFPHLKSLAIFRCFFDGDVSSILPHFPLLQLLKLTVANGGDSSLPSEADPQQSPVLRQAFNLRELHLGVDLSHPICNWILEHGRNDGFAGCECHLNLRHTLNSRNDIMSLFSSLLRAFSTNLVELQISFIQDWEVKWQNRFTSLDINLFKHIRHLTLKLGSHPYFTRGIGILLFVEIIVPSMSLLESLKIDVFSFDIPSLERFNWARLGNVIKPTSFPRLQSVSLQSRSPARGEEIPVDAVAYLEKSLPVLRDVGLLRFVYLGRSL